jgi:hypothetical protein
MERTRQLIDAAWKTWWDAIPAPFPVEYHSQAHVTPATGVYGRLSINFGDVSPGAVGPVMDRMQALLCLQIFLPADSQYSVVTSAADAVRTFWRYKQIDDTTGGTRTHIDFGNVELSLAGSRDGYKQFNLWVPFRVDKFFP